jgi:basic endochitinase B
MNPRGQKQKEYCAKIYNMKNTFSFFFLLLLLANSGCGQQTGSLVPLKESLQNGNKTNVTKYLDEKKWNDLFPHRYGIGLTDSINHNPDFYSFKAFVTAAKTFPSFVSEGDEIIQKRELAAFLANIAQETSGGWQTAPGGYFKWGLYFLQENNIDRNNFYNDTSKKNYPGVEGEYYYGRGPKQITWNYNYGQFSEAWFGNKDTLLQHPELLSKDPVLSFASAIWFWMTPQFPKPSCHDIMIGKWIPTASDTLKGRMPGFGATVNVINGGVECGSGTSMPKTQYRYEYYQYFCKYFNVSPGENISCANQKPFGQ